jgi:hypothetical protein
MKNSLPEAGIGALAGKTGKRRVDLGDRTGIEYLDLQPHAGSGFLHVLQCGFGVCIIGRIDEQGNSNDELTPIAVLTPLYELIKAHVFAAERIQGDDTTAPVLAKLKTRNRPVMDVRPQRPALRWHRLVGGGLLLLT